MSNYSGILEPDIFCEDDARASATIANASTDPITLGVLESVIPLAKSARTDNLPISMLEIERDGTKVNSFLDDFYYRIHVNPAAFDLGAILSQVVQTFIVWNSYFVQKTCTAINTVGLGQTDMDGLTAPFSLNPLGYTTYTLTIPQDGDPQIETTITYDFGDTDLPIVTISGDRITLFSWRPQVPINEVLEWLTNIIKSKDGSEQRISIRRTPRQSFKFSILLDDEQDQARLDAAMFKWQKRQWGLPVWTELVVHSGTITAGQTSITVDTTNADFRAESLAVIWQSSTAYEVVKIDSVASGSLTLSAAILGNFSGDKVIMPLRIAQMNAQTSRKDHSSGLIEMVVSFIVKDNTQITGYTAPVTHKTLPVLSVPSYIDDTQEKSSDGDIVVSDFQTGIFEIYSDSDFNKVGQSHLFYNDSKADCWTFRKFLQSLCGQQGTIFIPTFKNDLTLADTIGSSDTAFDIVNIGLAKNMGLNAMRTHLAFIFPNGTHIYRQITGITDSGSTEIVSIESSLGVEVHVGDCVVSFLDKCRLADDKVEIQWPIAHENECRVNFVAVKE